MTLGEFVELHRGYDLPESERHPGNVPVVGSSGNSGWHDTAVCKGPGVTVGRSGASIGVVTYTRDDFWALNTVLYVSDFRGNDPRFVYYLLKSIDFQGFNSGTAQPSLNRNYIYPIRIAVPPLNEQRHIARALGAFDDKIATSLSIADCMGRLTQEIFRSRFVEFTPIRTGKVSPLARATDRDDYDLFPDSLDPGGAVPLGWSRCRLGELCTLRRDGVDPSTVDPETPYVGLEHMPQRSLVLANWGKASEVESHKFAFRAGDILFGKLRPYFHKVGMVVVDGVCSSDIFVVTANEPWIPFVLGHLSDSRLIAIASAAATGTRMPRASWLDIANYQVALPPHEVAVQFGARVRPILDSMRGHVLETHAVRALRDSLTPAIMQGDLGRSRTAQEAG